ncbi:MAG: ABC transporter ATP-binding protein [Syntrophales bacterium]|nr:ABC transporter ATP-binding protein [Syntrophales bacterium]
MKSRRGEPKVFTSRALEERRAELQVEDIHLHFGGVKALNGVSLKVKTGEILAVIGPNGAGKTSLMNCITGFYRPDRGKIIFNGRDITRLKPHHLVPLGIGRTFQNIELFPGMTVLANLMLARHIHTRYSFGRALFFSPTVKKEEITHREIIEDIIDFLELQPIRKKPVGSLPYGLMKRVELGRALALEPKLLVLDEPFAGMTFEEKEDMVRFIREMNEGWGQTMILVEHDMAVVMSLSHRIVVLNFGEKLAEGVPEEIKNNEEVIHAYLG